MSKLSCGAMIFGIAAVWSGAADAANPSCSFVGVFSNLAYDEKTGDISGDEIIITLSPYGHEAIFTEAQGNLPTKPVVTDAKISNGSLHFQVQVGSNTVSVTGTPSCKELDATFVWSTGSKYSVKLPRTRSFWDTSQRTKTH